MSDSDGERVSTFLIIIIVVVGVLSLGFIFVALYYARKSIKNR